uniref:Uncharacterized protein n=1 Tax=Gasterosteus aculeatus aculeatus TaxID=481459 RepID=A0AAQ4S210_GASAC
ITMDASFRARDAFISPSAAITYTWVDKGTLGWLTIIASRKWPTLASASAAMALCNCCGSFTSLISTRSTLMPQLSVPGSSSPGHFSGWFEPADGWRNRH